MGSIQLHTYAYKDSEWLYELLVYVMQGSDSLASWQANLFFEPTKFEVRFPVTV